MPNFLQTPIEAIPLDAGWVGFVFMFINGFLLSTVLARDGIDATERLLLAIGLGSGVTILLMILTGILWEISLFTVVLTQTSLLATLLLAAIFRGWKPNIKERICNAKNANFPKFSLVEISILIIIGVYMFVALNQTVAYPAIEWDSLAYGVNYAKIIFQKGAIPLIAGPSIGLEMSASYPPGIQLVAVYFYTFAGNVDDFYFRILQPFFGLATMIATYKFGMMVTRNRTASFFAMLVLSAIPAFWGIFVQETYLMLLTLTLTLSVFFLYKAYYSDSVNAKKYEIIGAFFCSFSALTSYMGVFSFGLLLLYAIKKQMSLKRFTWIILLSFFTIMPWYARNYLLLGNPIYPFFGIGKYLDPLLLSSAILHFQNWSKVPFFGLYSTISKVGAALLFSAIVYLTATKRKLFLLIFPSYLLLVGLVIMATHIPFIRYLVIAMPSLAIVLAESSRFLLATRNTLKRITPVILIALIIALNVAVLPIINSYKPTSTLGNDKSSYLIQVFEEGDAWKWINDNTPLDARIATFDIKEYYLERDTLQLDGNESAPLYEMDTIEEGINFLQERNVTHVLSVPWASLGDVRMPLAYLWCNLTLTRYLGDDDYLPAVYVGRNGTSIYHVGPLDNPLPIKHITLDLTITNNTYPYACQFYLPIPVDYRNGTMTVFVKSSKSLVAELWNGLVPVDEIKELSASSDPIIEWPIQSRNSSSLKEPSFIWQVDKAGYFTFRIVDREETLSEDFDITLDLRFYNYFELKSF